MSVRHWRVLQVPRKGEGFVVIFEWASELLFRGLRASVLFVWFEAWPGGSGEHCRGRDFWGDWFQLVGDLGFQSILRAFDQRVRRMFVLCAGCQSRRPT